MTDAEGSRIDLSECRIGEQDLRWADLDRADLRWADLREAVVDGAVMPSGPGWRVVVDP